MQVMSSEGKKQPYENLSSCLIIFIINILKIKNKKEKQFFRIYKNLLAHY